LRRTNSPAKISGLKTAEKPAHFPPERGHPGRRGALPEDGKSL